MDIQKISSKIFITGKSGFGKTVYSKIISKDIKRLIVIDPLQEYENTIVCETLEDLTDYLKKQNEFRISVFDDSLSEDIFEIAWIVENITIVIEEVDIICNPSFIGRNFGNCLKRGRHKGIDLIYSTQRPALVNRLLTSQLTDCIVFQTTEPLDIKYLANYVNSRKELIDELGNLQPLNFINLTKEKKGVIIDFNNLSYI